MSCFNKSSATTVQEQLGLALDRLSGSGGPRIVAIVVTWNSSGYIDECLNSIKRSTQKVATLVVDNGSADDSASKAELRGDPDVIVMRTGINLGYAGGNNLALSMASAEGTDFAVIINPDASIDPDCIGRLINVLKFDPSVGLASPAICYASSDVVWYGGSVIDPLSATSYLLHEGSPLANLPDLPFNTGRACGCVMALVPGRIQGVGLLDERFFLYYEETEWSLRIRGQGLQIVVVPTAVAWHDVGHGTGGANPTYQYYMTRNRLLFASLYATRGALGALPLSLRDAAVTVLTMARRNRSALIPCGLAIIRGYLDFARGRFGQQGPLFNSCHRWPPAAANRGASHRPATDRT